MIYIKVEVLLSEHKFQAIDDHYHHKITQLSILNLMLILLQASYKIKVIPHPTLFQRIWKGDIRLFEPSYSTVYSGSKI